MSTQARDQGAIAVETALIAIPFFLLIFGGMQIMLAMYSWSGISEALEEGARVGILGYEDLTSVKTLIASRALAYGVHVELDQIEVCNLSALGDDPSACESVSDHLGGPGDLVRYRIQKPILPIFANGMGIGTEGLQLEARVHVINEG